MDRQQILLAKSLNAAQVPLDIKTFDNRLILQKAVFLLQSAGIKFGYRFRWYLRGPYSPDMTSDAFGILREGDSAEKELKQWKLDGVSAELAGKLQPLLKRDGESAEEQAKRLEVLASVLFLFNTGQAPREDHESTSKVLKRNGKDFDVAQVREASSELEKYGLVA